MSIIKCDNYIDAYKERAKSDNIHELSGRGTRVDLTEYVSEQIISHLDFKEDDMLVDIGCGDGTLLSKLKYLEVAIGILPTDEEVNKVEQRFTQLKNISIQQGFAQKIDLSENYATKVVCNGVFILMKLEDIEKAMMEIVRISKNDAAVFIGEVPIVDESDNKNYGDSIVRWLLWILNNQGGVAFFSRIKQVIKAYFSKEPFIISPKTYFFMEPDVFVKLAKSYGLEIQQYFTHKELHEGIEQDSNTRYDYIFKVKKLGA